MGRAGYRKLEDEAIDNYSSRGHLSMFKRVSGGGNTSTMASKNSGTNKVSSSAAKIPKTSTTGNDYSKITNKSLQRKITKYVQEATNWEHSEGARDYTWKDTLRALSDPGEKTVRSRVDKMISGGETSKNTSVKKAIGSSSETAASLRARADKMDADAAKANRKKSLDTLKSKGYTRYGDFYFKPSKEGSINGSYMMVSSNGTMRSLAPFEKESAKSTVARKMGKKYTPKPVR